MNESALKGAPASYATASEFPSDVPVMSISIHRRKPPAAGISMADTFCPSARLPVSNACLLRRRLATGNGTVGAADFFCGAAVRDCRATGAVMSGRPFSQNAVDRVGKRVLADVVRGDELERDQNQHEFTHGHNRVHQ